MIESAEDLAQDAGNYLLYYDRIVTKKEVAKRCSLFCDLEVNSKHYIYNFKNILFLYIISVLIFVS